LPEPDGLRPEAPPARDTPPDGSAVSGNDGSAVSGNDGQAVDRSREHAGFYLTILVVLMAGAVLLRRPSVFLNWASVPSVHTLMESIATVLAFIIGGLSLVRFYSRKQITFLFIGCGFLGAALLNLNHALATADFFLNAHVQANPDVRPADVFAQTWTAERGFLSIFLFMSLLLGGQAVRAEEDEGGISEGSVYGWALAFTIAYLLFFQYLPVAQLSFPFRAISRPTEFVPAALFLFAFVGFLRKGNWRRDAFEHWLLVSLLISVLAHAAFMAFSEQRFDSMFDAAHLLKITSYVALLAGLLSSVYETFQREARALDALTDSNEALAHEIEVRAHTEQAVKESSRRLQEFLDNANDLIQSVAADGRILYVNSSWKRVLGYADADLERLTLFDIVHPAHRGPVRKEFKRILDGGTPRRFDVDYVAADGRVVMLSGSVQVQQSAGRTVATQSILRDVTEQRLAETQLAEAQQNLEALVENTGDSIWSVDRHHRLITLNSAFALEMEARTGTEPQVGQLPAEVFLPQDVGWYEELYDRTLRGERHIALRTDEVDNQQRYFELYANPIQALDGVVGAVFFGKDVTERVRAQEALAVAKDEAEAANKAKSDFLANMSHELRTPLNSVIGFTNILLKNKDGRLVDKDIGFLERVLSNGKHLLALINEVLDLAKVEAGRMELIIEEIDLAALCTETVQQLEGQAKTKDGKVALVADVPAEVKLVETDSAKLKQVIINLVGNALKFTHEGSVTVKLELAEDGRTPVAIAVRDTGIGIPQDRLEAIFEAFQQAEAGTSRKYGGTGLGLALSRSICLLMGYDLIVESELGKGSTFKIVMGERAGKPVREPEVETAEPAPAAAPAARRGAKKAPGQTVAAPAVADDGVSAKPPRDFKVLVVDDEKDSRVLIAHYLEEFGCQVITASNGEEGLELARQHKPDLMTLDLIMPGITGWEVLKKLKADPGLRRIPVVVVSVLAGEGRGSLLGAVDLLTKPFEREDLLRVLWRHLGRNRRGRVLLLTSDAELTAGLKAFLSGRGLQVAVRKPGAGPFDALAAEAPDALLVEMNPREDTLGFLTKLRANRLYAGLPTFLLADGEVAPSVLDKMAELHVVVVPRHEPVAALDEVLGVLFPLADGAERRG
jgi:PAS domain S-box-containing protein